MMNLYLLSQEENINYDTFDSMVVCAKNKVIAKSFHPFGDGKIFEENEKWPSWAITKKGIKISLIGKASKKQLSGIICTSFNAG